jgi:hypothetical protein
LFEWKQHADSKGQMSDMTMDELQALAKKYFNKADFHEVVVI